MPPPQGRASWGDLHRGSSACLLFRISTDLELRRGRGFKACVLRFNCAARVLRFFAVVGFEPTTFQVFPKEVCWLVHWAIQWMTSLKNRPHLIQPKLGVFQIVNSPAQTPNWHENHFWNRGPFWTQKSKKTQVLPSPPFQGLFKQKKIVMSHTKLFCSYDYQKSS